MPFEQLHDKLIVDKCTAHTQHVNGMGSKVRDSKIFLSDNAAVLSVQIDMNECDVSTIGWIRLHSWKNRLHIPQKYLIRFNSSI